MRLIKVKSDSKRLLISGCLVSNLFLIGCTKNINSNSFDVCRTISFPCLRENVNVELYTSKGRIIFELYGESAPVTVGNFIDLINRGVYNKTTFHRVIKEPFPFVIQGGDSKSKNPNLNTNEIGLGNFIDPENNLVRYIPLEIKLINEGKPRYGKLIKDPKIISNLELRHQKGSISMSRSQPPNSASSQFFISLKSLPILDGRYAVFGKLVKGMNVLDLIEEGDSITKVVISLEKDN